MTISSEYRTSRGHLYGFSGWMPGESPLELFDAGEWLKCAHACTLMLSFCSEGTMRSALEDDGVLHELIHLSSGIDICLHQTLADLRLELKAIQDEAEDPQ